MSREEGRYQDRGRWPSRDKPTDDRTTYNSKGHNNGDSLGLFSFSALSISLLVLFLSSSSSISFSSSSWSMPRSRPWLPRSPPHSTRAITTSLFTSRLSPASLSTPSTLFWQLTQPPKSSLHHETRYHPPYRPPLPPGPQDRIPASNPPTDWPDHINPSAGTPITNPSCSSDDDEIIRCL